MEVDRECSVFCGGGRGICAEKSYLPMKVVGFWRAECEKCFWAYCRMGNELFVHFSGGGEIHRPFAGAEAVSAQEGGNRLPVEGRAGGGGTFLNEV